MGDQVAGDGLTEAEGVEDPGPGFNPFAMLQPWRPMCVLCADNHRQAIVGMVEQLKAMGKDPESEEFGQLMEQAMVLGEMLARNPEMLQNFEQVPPYIPAIRPADLLVNGNSTCVLCFTSQQPAQRRSSGLVAATPAGFMPGGLQKG